jgi:hypothetical protein
MLPARFTLVFLRYWDLNSGPTLGTTQPALYLWWVFFKIGSHRLFARAGLEPWSSWYLPPEYLGLQVWATGTQFGLVIFLIGTWIFAQAGLDLDSPVYASWVAGVTSMCHPTQVIGWHGISLTFFQTGLEPGSSWSLISASWVAGLQAEPLLLASFFLLFWDKISLCTQAGLELII